MPNTQEEQPEVSILVPALNEENTIKEVVERLLALPLKTEIIVINDGSTDSTKSILESFAKQIKTIHRNSPGGKGMAIREGLKIATGETVIIQDADLEYSPEQIPSLIQPILKGESTVVYGSRFIKGLHPGMALPNKVVNILLRWTVAILFWRKLTDEATCYKAFKRTILNDMDLQCKRFEFCPEVTAKAIRMSHDIKEVPISYEPRSKEAGKKIRWTDAPEAFWTLLKYRFWSKK